MTLIIVFLVLFFANFNVNNGQLSMPLRVAASKRGIFIGASLKYPDLLNSDQTYNKIAGEQYDLTTPGNACKWTATEPEKDIYNFTECDYVYNWAKSNNMTFRGHNLCWGNEYDSFFIF